MQKKKIQTNIIFPQDMWERAKIQAAREMVSLGEIVRKGLKEYLDKKQRIGEKKK
jgi:hypothetical protein